MQRHFWTSHFPSKAAFIFIIGTLMLFLAGCSHRSYLIVNYQVPEVTNRLQNLKIRVKINDARTDRYILAPAAQRQFKGFDNTYSLSWIYPEEKRTFAGEYDLEGLFQVAFEKRLEMMGVDVSSTELDRRPVLQIDIHELKIDLENRNWVAQMSYTASLLKDNQLVARDKVSGSAERVKIIGRKGADNTLSDIFSDIINKLKLDSLFDQAKLDLP